MATKEAATEARDEREEGGDSPLMDSAVQAVKKMVTKGRERGYITYEELNAALPADQVSSEQIEDVLAQLSEMGINVVEGEEQEETPSSGEAAATPAEPAPGNVVEEDLGRTDDPVRMYLREMGSVELLSREGEIAIAKRIEAGREKMIGSICESPLTIRAIIEWRDALKDERMLLRDIIDLDATHGRPEAEATAASGVVQPENGSAAQPDGAAAQAAGPVDAAGTAATAGPGAPAGPAAPGAAGPAAASESDDDSDEGDPENTLSLAAMEAKLKPEVLLLFDEIAKTYKRFHKLQEQRLAGMRKKAEALSTAQERRYVKLQHELVELMERVHLNNNRIEMLVDELYGLSRRLTSFEGKLLRMAMEAGVDRDAFLEQYIGTELDPRWASRVSRLKGRAGRRSPASTPIPSRSSARRSRPSPTVSVCRSPSSGASFRSCNRASARRPVPRRKWSRPTCGWSSRSPRNTRTAACNSWT